MNTISRSIFLSIALFTASIGFTAPAFAHCEIPCGIYDDEAKFDELDLHVKTIKRSIEGIQAAENTHDATRWVINKENHAQKIQDEIAVYFLTQRVKAPVKSKEKKSYAKSLKLAHQILVAAMKAKQSADMEKAEELQKAINAYRDHYFELHGHKH
ncbi:superoxide dismutase [Ni] [Hirschia maritima]|uniref:superoxide dismutase [Ni] n=1 Tax=Hirschia maritima TaxID=1121961 RepID=UPI000363D389|nr:superoxide dismutase [Ni] [Hirschia maritima]